MDKDYKTMIEELGWEIEQKPIQSRLLYAATKGSRIVLSHDIVKLYHGCMMMETIGKWEQVEDNPLKDLIVKEPPVTEKKKKILEYFKFKLYEEDKSYVNETVKIGIDITDINVISAEKLFRTLDVLTQAGNVSEEKFRHMINQLNKKTNKER